MDKFLNFQFLKSQSSFQRDSKGSVHLGGSSTTTKWPILLREYSNKIAAFALQADKILKQSNQNWWSYLQNKSVTLKKHPVHTF